MQQTLAEEGVIQWWGQPVLLFAFLGCISRFSNFDALKEKKEKKRKEKKGKLRKQQKAPHIN